MDTLLRAGGSFTEPLSFEPLGPHSRRVARDRIPTFREPLRALRFPRKPRVPSLYQRTGVPPMAARITGNTWHGAPPGVPSFQRHPCGSPKFSGVIPAAALVFTGHFFSNPTPRPSFRGSLLMPRIEEVALEVTRSFMKGSVAATEAMGRCVPRTTTCSLVAATYQSHTKSLIQHHLHLLLKRSLSPDQHTERTSIRARGCVVESAVDGATQPGLCPNDLETGPGAYREMPSISVYAQGPGATEAGHSPVCFLSPPLSRFDHLLPFFSSPSPSILFHLGTVRQSGLARLDGAFDLPSWT